MTLWPTFGDNKITVPTQQGCSKFTDESYIGKEVIMGIRPENIHDEDVFIADRRQRRHQR